MRLATTALIVVGTLALGACSTGNAKFENLDAQTQATYQGTQTGYHRVGSYFGAQVDGGKWNERLMQFYFYPTGNGRKKLIGVTSAVLFDGADYGPTQQHFAVADDGTSLLYFHEQQLGYGRITGAPDGLYLIRAGQDEQWLRPIDDHVINPTEIDRYLSGN